MNEEIQKYTEYCLNCPVKPCSQKGCPLNNDIPAFIKQVKEGNIEEAYKILSKTTVLGSVCGRICPHMKQCEGSCVRGIKGEPVQIGEIEAEYKSRPEGSFSKLNTFKDGFRILGLMIYLLMTEKPIIFWWIIAFIFAMFGFYYGIPIIISFIKEGFVPIAASVLAAGFILLSGISIITGLIMNAIGRVIYENRRLKYNSFK